MNKRYLYATPTEKKIHGLCLVLTLLIFIWSYDHCVDFFAWFVLVVPAFLFVMVLFVTYPKFQFTTMTYIFVVLYILILMIGAKYTYTENPLFEYFVKINLFTRNHYDRIGHLAQGFIPVFLIKEVFLRAGYMKRSRFFIFVVFCVALAISAAWELLEFTAAMVSGESADYILGLQGDIWDTQWDMLLALIGAFLSMLTFGHLHNKAINKVMARTDGSSKNI